MSKGVEIRREAVDILAACMACRDVEIFKELADADPENYDWKRREAEGYLERCLPAIRTTYRAELEEELLSDRAVIAANAEIGFALQTKLPRDRREHVKAAIKAALSIGGETGGE